MKSEACKRQIAIPLSSRVRGNLYARFRTRGEWWQHPPRLFYDATTSINIDTVTESNTAEATINTFTTTVSGLASDIVSTDGAPGTPVAVGSTNTETLTVDLTGTYNDNLGAGDYTYTVNLVANP